MSYELDDAAVPEELAAVVAAADPLPYDTLQSLRACFSRRSLDAELAELVYDSVLEEPVGVRSDAGSRQLSFHGARVSVEMQVVPERQRVVGQLVPATESQVEVRHAGGSFVVHSDKVGRFVTDGIPKGPVSFRCTGETGDDPFVTVTDWIVL